MDLSAYKQEFDGYVEKYIEWIDSCKQGKDTKSVLGELLSGTSYLFSILKQGSVVEVRSYPDLFPKNFDPTQRDTVALGSDWRIVQQTLDKIISNDAQDSELTVEQAEAGKKFAERIYENMRESYALFAFCESR